MYDQLLFSSFPQRHLNLVSTQAIKKSHYLACSQKNQLHHLPNLADVTLPYSVPNMGSSKGQLEGCSHTSAGRARALLYTCPYYSYRPFRRSEFSFQYMQRIQVGLNSILYIITQPDGLNSILYIITQSDVCSKYLLKLFDIERCSYRLNYFLHISKDNS